jgi:hypothetical protein
MYFIGRQFFFLTIKITRTAKIGIIKLAQNPCAAAKKREELLHADLSYRLGQFTHNAKASSAGTYPTDRQIQR